ncbi:HAD family hydrolase [Bradyrhizobium erythrophlei]|uniref:Haloacid dehalogenase superfamily, subfamily IA, variant 3 with third motif having DD or ED/haloacid dehalogenase superfamily, subfamily IA, variant 1 with third motif having Dx(3-4)D or Dx(3-4)E n=1 Tax=Bradyrhizobium erythrophlei TaxID=1437360 RepID=A0A1M7UWS5_9BRAD|nr:HAD-IA family hydrolase [Bradyrhizobium erythrophlei]SHN87390.1 haloacid dehalogenase superfamily, subfamily IA, variant 3 with third motif having DD or ED/haloacid dehalogenase superfamily, subfamily IA, variant 1 with third motif having Dx(3-4)D or Dx(3-4)E [Bradyrhizobium erythrophlei]
MDARKLTSQLSASHRAIIYDFDGVLADSEVLSNSVIADVVSELGVPTTVDDAYRTYMGKRLVEVIETIERVTGRRLPADFADSYQRRTFDVFRARLEPVDGARAFLAAWRDVPNCIASSSSPERLALSLEVLDMAALFEGRVFSASNVARGKPHPDIFLYAAEQLGIAPADCIVIEDSLSGITGARAAGATAIGLTAASHVQPGHDTRLREAGADHVVQSFAELDRIIRPLLRN